MIQERTIQYVDLGMKPYDYVLKLQVLARDQRINNGADDLVIFCEHEPVYTTGKQDCSNEFLATNEIIKKAGIKVFETDRGGKVTYHGPGQIVVYYILKTDDYSSGVKDFVSRIEDVCMDFCAGYGLLSGRKKEYPGIWIQDKKIAAIGLHISKGVSMHGMSVNIDPDMSHYNYIVPCGIREYGVTSLAGELRRHDITIGESKRRLIISIERVFNCRLKKSGRFHL